MKKNMYKQILTLVIFLSLVANTGAFDFSSGRGIGLGQSVLLSETSASSLVNLPGAGINNNQWKMELGVNRKFELKELDEIIIAGALRKGKFSFSLGLSQFGYADLYSEKTVKLSSAYVINEISFGLSFSGLFLDFGGGYEGLSALTFGLSANYHKKNYYASFMADNLTLPKLEENSPEYRPKFNFYFEYDTQKSFSVTARTTFENRQKPQFALGQIIDISTDASILWGLSSEPLIYGGGLEYDFKSMLFDYTVSYHPVLGFTHGISITYGSKCDKGILIEQDQK